MTLKATPSVNKKIDPSSLAFVKRVCISFSTFMRNRQGEVDLGSQPVQTKLINCSNLTLWSLSITATVLHVLSGLR